MSNCSPAHQYSVTSLMNFGTTLIRGTLALCALSFSTPRLAAGWTKLEDFQAHTLNSNVNSQHGWTSGGAVHPIVTDPANPANKVLSLTNDNNAAMRLNSTANSAVNIPNGSSATLFLRFRFSGTMNYSFGMSDVATGTSPNFGDYESQFNHNEITNQAHIRDAGVFRNLDPATPMQPNTWYNIWMVINNAADTTTVYLDTATAPGGTTTALQSSAGKTAFSFRNGTASNALNCFVILSASVHSGTVLLDEIYLDSAGTNLTNPATPATNIVSAVNDSIEVGVDGAIGFDPTLNDVTTFGKVDPSTLEIVSQPVSGTAVFDPVTRRLIYQHTGTSPGTDTFQYRVSNGSAPASTATVNVSISGAARLANTTSTLPATPPSAGSLQIVEALPGLTFNSAVAMTPVPGSPKSLIVASINGSVWMVPDTTAATPVKKELFSVASLSNFTRGRSIYSIVCHPGFGTPGSPGFGQIIVNYQGHPDGFQTPPPYPNTGAANPNSNTLGDTDISCTLRVARFTASQEDLNTLLTSTSSSAIAAAKAAIMASELRYINLAEEALYHSINDCHFGPDGYLYVTLGDEGEQGEPYLNAQYITRDQYSAVIRIDVDKKPGNLEPNPHYAIPTDTNGLAYFSIPADNPYVGWPMSYNGAPIPEADRFKVRTEIYATGFRNPFKFDIDGPTGDLWVGDVGMDLWEEVTRIQKGQNAGWSFWEGNHERTNIPHRVPVVDPTFPEVEYPHGSEGNSVTGGLLYRGNAYPSTGLQGKYIFGDFGSGKVWTHVPGTNTKELLPAGGLSSVVDFEVDPQTGQILLLQHTSAGKVMRLIEGAPVVDSFPQKLSDTGIFANLSTLVPNPGVVPYQPNLKFWSDHADKSRFFVIKNLTDKMAYSRSGNWTFPEGMVFVKHFDMDLNRDLPGTQIKRLETRFLVRNSSGVYGVSYKWNETGTDAFLVEVEGNDFDLPIVSGGITSAQRWHIPSRNECLNCHNPAAGYALSLTTQQLNRTGQIAATNGNFLTLLSQSDYLSGLTDNPATLPRIYRPDETNINLDERVRSYLTVNCTYCHRDGGGANQSWGIAGHESIEQMAILYGVPLSETYHKPEDRFIIPGSKGNSLIYNRIQARSIIGDGTYHGYSQMPPIATNVVDQQGVQLLAEWIDHYANVTPAIRNGSLSSTTVSENADVGTSLGGITTLDPDVRAGVTDASQIRYAIIGGDPDHLFDVHPLTGEVIVNGVLDYESATQFQLEVAISDRFAPNPKTVVQVVNVNLSDVPGVADATADLNGNGIPDAWEQSFGLSGNPSIDTDGDGKRDFFEYLGGGDPTANDTGKAAGVQIVSFVGNTAQYTWRVRNGINLGQHYLAQASTDLDSWHTLLPGEYTIVSTTPDGPGFSKVVISVPSPTGVAFLRLSSP